MGLYETFVAACYQKAGEVDDSSGDYTMFGGPLFCSWVTARSRRQDGARAGVIVSGTGQSARDTAARTRTMSMEVSRRLVAAGTRSANLVQPVTVDRSRECSYELDS